MNPTRGALRDGEADETPSPAEYARIDEACDAFEAAWRNGGAPYIEDKLLSVQGPVRGELLRELLLIDLAYRLRKGDVPRPEDYHARLPDDAETIRAAFAAASAIETSVASQRPYEVAETVAEPGQLERLARVSHSPDLVERYTLTRLHAQGGIGRVWLARDADLGREVALKELRPERAADPAVWARFLEEARITGQLEHPGVVPVYEIVRRPGHESPFYTMRFVRGRTLSEASRSYHTLRHEGKAGPLDLISLVGAFVAVCQAVAYAHSRGVIHRDLKGSNIVLGDFGEVMVLDWGLAKILGREEPREASDPCIDAVSCDDREATVPGQVLGTPAYMAPEQAEGRTDLVGPRTDVYGLGAVLYEILTGRPPFVGPDSHELLRQVRELAPERPRQLNPEAPPALEAVCLKAMDKAPSERYGSVAELSREVQRWQAGEPVDAWPEPLLYRARRWVVRHRTAAAAAAVGAAVLVAALGVGLILQRQANRKLASANVALGRSLTRERDALANERSARAREQAALARARQRFDLARSAVESYYRGVNEEVLLGRPELGDLRKRLLKNSLDFYQRLRETLEEDARAEPEVRADLASADFRVAMLNEQLGIRGDAIAALQQAREIEERLLRAHPDDYAALARLIEDLNFLGRYLGYAGRTAEAEEALRQSLKLCETLRNVRVSEADWARSATSWGNRIRRPAELATIPPRRAWVLAGEAWAHHALGLTRWHANDLSGAREHLRKAAEPWDDLERDYTEFKHWYRFSSSAARHDLANLLSQMGHTAEATTAMRKVLELNERRSRDQPDDTSSQRDLAAALNDLAHELRQAGPPIADVLPLYERSIAIQDRLVRASPNVRQYGQDRAVTYLDIGELWQDDPRGSEAMSWFLRARGEFERLVRDDPSNHHDRSLLARAERALASAAERSRRPDLAFSSYRAAIRELNAAVRLAPGMQSYYADLTNTWLAIGTLEHRCGHPDLAARSSREALAAAEATQRAFPQRVSPRWGLARVKSELAELRHAMGDDTEALTLRREAAELASEVVRAKAVPESSVDRGLAEQLIALADLLVAMGRGDDAAAALERVAPIAEDPPKKTGRDETAIANLRIGYEIARGGQLTLAGDRSSARTAFERVVALVRSHPRQDADHHYSLARAEARLSALLDGDPALAEEAVRELRRALELNFSRPWRYRIDPDFAPLRHRADFQTLLRDLDFPDWPFALEPETRPPVTPPPIAAEVPHSGEEATSGHP
jgi:serine/threonine-protein kinase